VKADLGFVVKLKDGPLSNFHAMPRGKKIVIAGNVPHRKHGTPKCACEAFKFLDQFYHDNPDIRPAWAEATAGTQHSAYDYFMGLNLKRMQVGIPGLIYPPPGGYRQQDFLTPGKLKVPPLCLPKTIDTVKFTRIWGPEGNEALEYSLSLWFPPRDTKAPGRHIISVGRTSRPEDLFEVWGDTDFFGTRVVEMNMPPGHIFRFDQWIDDQHLDPIHVGNGLDYHGPFYNKPRV